MPNGHALQTLRDTQPALLGSAAPDRLMEDQPADCAQLPCLRILTGRQPNRRVMWAGLLGELIAHELVEETHQFIAAERGAGREL